jgi:hypothetical protein
MTHCIVSDPLPKTNKDAETIFNVLRTDDIGGSDGYHWVNVYVTSYAQICICEIH